LKAPSCTVTSAAAPIHAIPRFGLTEYRLGFVVLILKVVLAPTATTLSFCTVAVPSATGKRSSEGSMRTLVELAIAQAAEFTRGRPRLRGL